jgi:hypothetical protein
MSLLIDALSIVAVTTPAFIDQLWEPMRLSGGPRIGEGNYQDSATGATCTVRFNTGRNTSHRVHLSDVSLP